MTLPEHTDPHPDLQDAVLREQTRLIIRQVPTMQATSSIVALVLAYTVRSLIPRANIVLWLMLVLGVVAGRGVLYIRFMRVRDTDFDAAPWKNAYLALSLISGVVWGLSAFLIFPSGNDQLIALFVLVMASLSAATTVSHSAVKSGPALWMVPVMLLYAVRCIGEWNEPENTIALLVVVYLITLLRYSLHHHEVITSSLTLKFENLLLLDEVRRANDVLLRASTIDGLTGLANRRALDEFMEREWRRAARHQRPLAVILLDIDQFKAYNDTYGHPAGDACLRTVAATINQSLRRPSDFAARYGGEEFVVVLPDANAEGAREVAEVLRREVEALAMPHVRSTVSSVVTISAGSAALVPHDEMTFSDLVSLADAALYTAKQGGRNRVHAF